MNDDIDVEVQHKQGISAVWIIPLVALIFGAYLGVKAYLEKGVDIVLTLQSAEGLVPGKTEVKYRGLTTGLIKEIRLDEGLKSVSVLIEMDAHTKTSLGSDAAFWLVKPEVSLSGVTGLETITSGNYIAFRPSYAKTDEPMLTFKALPAAPPLPSDTPGLHLTLYAESKGSIQVGTKIFYRRIEVGEVTTVGLQDENKEVQFGAHILPDFQHLVSEKTRFWTTGGVKVKGGLQRFEVEAGSLISLIGGGITFDQIGDAVGPTQPTENGDRFPLFEDYEDALFSKMIQIEFPAAEGIEAGITPIIYNGVTVGEVKAVDIDSNLKKISVTAGINPRFDWTLKDSTQFWLVSPSVEEGNFDGLLTGSYVTLIPGDGKNRTEFKAQVNAPIFNPSAPGLQFVVEAKTAGSIHRGSGIYYQNMLVGKVQGVSLNKKRGGVDIYGHIGPEHASLVKRGSRFYQASGVTVKGDLSGFKIQTESLASIVRGGIAFYTPKEGAPSKVAKDGAVFKLFEDYEHANAEGVAIKILFDQANGLRVSMPIKYQDQKVGEVTAIEFGEGLEQVIVSAMLNGRAVKYARKDSRIWLVQPQLGLTSVKNVETIVTGTYLEVSPGKGEATYQFVGIDRPPVVKARNKGLNIVLNSQRLGSIEVGDPVSYRQIPVGEVIGVDLAPDSNSVLVYINIYSRFSKLIRNDTVFWNGSGISVEAGLFTGLKINTESMESILAGGIELATPPASGSQKPVEDGMQFELYEEENAKWLEWQPTINIDKS
ncbi:MAG: MlaD family protein [Pseudomonadales bacterium]|nr:MlaD family protein [Pseudomonadales bacterium]